MRSVARDDVVVDTMILQKANATLNHSPKSGTLVELRLQIIRGIINGDVTILISSRLLAEYDKQIPKPRNDFIKLFIELIQPSRSSKNVIFNWHTPWGGSERSAMKQCRFPTEDKHVLRTAVRKGKRSAILTEEKRMLEKAACILKEFDVRISGLK